MQNVGLGYIWQYPENKKAVLWCYRKDDRAKRPIYRLC